MTFDLERLRNMLREEKMKAPDLDAADVIEVVKQWLPSTDIHAREGKRCDLCNMPDDSGTLWLVDRIDDTYRLLCGTCLRAERDRLLRTVDRKDEQMAELQEALDKERQRADAAERVRDRYCEDLHDLVTEGEKVVAVLAQRDRRIAELEAALRDSYGIVKRSFVTQGEDGRHENTVDPGSQVRIKAALRRHIDAALSTPASPAATTRADLELLAKFASGDGGRRTGELMRLGYLECKVTQAGMVAIGVESAKTRPLVDMGSFAEHADDNSLDTHSKEPK